MEDEPKLAAILADYLKAESYLVSVLYSGTEVITHVHNDKPDLILLDIMLPGQDGLSLCRDIRHFSNVPIIIVTARGEEIDRLLGLNLGADDYICKPFSPREVVARVKAILRRSCEPSIPHSSASQKNETHEIKKPLPQFSETALSFFALDETGYTASYNGRRLDLTPAEFRLLLLFTRNPGRVFSREHLLDALYDDNRVVTDRTIDTHVKNLRRKLHQAQAPENCIASVYSVGYRFDPL